MAACPKCGTRNVPKNKATGKRECRRDGPIYQPKFGAKL